MAPRAKRKLSMKAASKKQLPPHATPETEAPDTNAKKRKIDWATIDDPAPFGGFTLTAVKGKAPKNAAPSVKKQKTTKSGGVESEYYRDAPMDADIVQKNPFLPTELSETHYQVEPPLAWESTQRYRKFTISDAEFEVGQIVFIHIGEDEPAIGRVLEVRAGDASHVFLRIYYLYRPEELPEGRQPHHGDSELIASNHMDIVEALSVSDRAHVVYWNEDPENSEWPLRDQLFWRQTYDIEKPKAQQLSKLRPFCIDKAPCNPDEPLINCHSCLGWLHAHCLEDQAVEAAYEEHKVPAKGRPAKSKKKGARRSSAGAQFTARLTTQDSGQVCLTVTDKRTEEDNKRWNVDVKCLLCKAVIEAATDALPEAVAADVTEIIDDGAATSTIAPESDAPKAADEGAEEEEENSVMGNDDEVATEPKIEVPTSETAAPDLEPEPVHNARARGPPRKRARSNGEKVLVGAEIERQMKLDIGGTPLAEVSESVLQSGIRSVKRLLWRTS